MFNLFKKAFMYEGIRNKCCTNDNIYPFLRDLFQCITCRRIFRMNEKMRRKFLAGKLK